MSSSTSPESQQVVSYCLALKTIPKGCALKQDLQPLRKLQTKSGGKAHGMTAEAVCWHDTSPLVGPSVRHTREENADARQQFVQRVTRANQ